MKRIICSLVCSCLVLSLLFGATVITNAEDEMNNKGVIYVCLLYTSDAADEL